MANAQPVCDFGRPAADFALPGVDGRILRLSEVRGPHGTLVMFLANHCPYVKGLIDRLVPQVDALRREGIGAVAIMANDTAAYPEDSLENMKRFAAERRFGFPYLIDESQAIARAYGASVTPEFFGYNSDLRLQYHGRLDDGVLKGGPPRQRELFDAMRQIAASDEGPREQHAGHGCSIKWRESGRR
ncbi:MAG: thioredoxin family protein [Pseudomonadota bacterium]